MNARLLTCILCALWALPPSRARGAEPVIVFAAASLTSVLQEVLPADGEPPSRLSFAGSAALARQIDAGAPADIYLSASPRWMTYLQDRGRIDSTSRSDLLANHLVIVAPKGEGFAAEPRAGYDLAGALDGRLAIGDPDHVPAGIYARQALQALGWWPALRGRLAPAADVRAALVLVERGECPAGIVYATDAAISARVEVVATLPDSLHEPIRYPAAIITGRATPAARAVLTRLRSPAAAAVFARHGFVVLRGSEASPAAGARAPRSR